MSNKVGDENMENLELLSKNIREALENAKCWQRVPTTEPGIFLIKAPVRGDQENLMVEINPLDELGRPIKRRGIFLTNAKQLEHFKEVMILS